MRSKIFIAIMATAIIMSSCEWLTSRSSTNSASLLQGKWRLDSMSQSIDSGQVKLTGMPVNFTSKELDSANITYEFRADTVFACFANTLSDTSLFTAQKNEVTLKRNDSTAEVFALSVVNDTAMILTSKANSLRFRRLD